VPVILLAEQLIVAVPRADADKVATAPLEVNTPIVSPDILQAGVKLIEVPEEFFAVATKVWLWLTRLVAVDGDISIVVIVVNDEPVTVTDALALFPLQVAVTDPDPAVVAVNNPFNPIELIVPILPLTLQVGVSAAVVLSE